MCADPTDSSSLILHTTSQDLPQFAAVSTFSFGNLINSSNKDKNNNNNNNNKQQKAERNQLFVGKYLSHIAVTGWGNEQADSHFVVAIGGTTIYVYNMETGKLIE